MSEATEKARRTWLLVSAAASLLLLLIRWFRRARGGEDPTPDPTPDPGSEPDLDPIPDADPAPEPAPEPEPTPDPGPSIDTEIIPGPEVEPAPEPAPESEPEEPETPNPPSYATDPGGGEATPDAPDRVTDPGGEGSPSGEGTPEVPFAEDPEETPDTPSWLPDAGDVTDPDQTPDGEPDETPDGPESPETPETPDVPGVPNPGPASATPDAPDRVTDPGSTSTPDPDPTGGSEVDVPDRHPRSGGAGDGGGEVDLPTPDAPEIDVNPDEAIAGVGAGATLATLAKTGGSKVVSGATPAIAAEDLAAADPNTDQEDITPSILKKRGREERIYEPAQKARDAVNDVGLSSVYGDDDSDPTPGASSRTSRTSDDDSGGDPINSNDSPSDLDDTTSTIGSDIPGLDEDDDDDEDEDDSTSGYTGPNIPGGGILR
jgi:hypothetical protein